MRERQRRADSATSNAVARGLNILAVRDQRQARHYMEYKQVPGPVIARVLDCPELRRRVSPEESLSEAITPAPPPASPES
jgi:hypothetical protein